MEHGTPELVWNDAMRTQLRYSMIALLNEYYSTDEVSESEAGPPIFESFQVDYRSINPEPVVGNVYLNLFIQNPTFALRDPLYVARQSCAFLMTLL